MAVARKISVFKKKEIGKNDVTFAEGPKLASKQKCVQDNSVIFADEGNNVIPTSLPKLASKQS
jgi:hypothetical protein